MSKARSGEPEHRAEKEMKAKQKTLKKDWLRVKQRPTGDRYELVCEHCKSIIAFRYP
jgi:hypothetical protein